MSNIGGVYVKINEQQAGEWLKNNPAAKTDPALVKVADNININKQVEPAELASAFNRGDVTLSESSFKVTKGSVPATTKGVDFSEKEKVGVSKSTSGSNAAGMMVSMFGGLAIMAHGGKVGQPAIGLVGMGVMLGGMMYFASKK